MPPQSRVGDNAFNPADAHGCLVCPHPVTGPGTAGSTDVMVNGMQAMRVGDSGVHSMCCGPNKWNVAAGSGTVFINDIPAARLGDQTAHCGGVGNLIAGSGNVIVGG